jgi:hypothetical protein
MDCPVCLETTAAQYPTQAPTSFSAQLADPQSVFEATVVTNLYERHGVAVENLHDLSRYFTTGYRPLALSD